MVTDAPILHVEMAGPVNHLTLRVTLGEHHCSGLLTREADGTWSLQWATGEHHGEVGLLALANARWHSALKRALQTCELRLIRRTAP